MPYTKFRTNSIAETGVKGLVKSVLNFADDSSDSKQIKKGNVKMKDIGSVT